VGCRSIDPARIGSARIGSSRIGVIKDLFDSVKKQFENLPAKTAGGIDPFITGNWRTGHVRTRVYLPLFDELLEKLGKVT